MKLAVRPALLRFAVIERGPTPSLSSQRVQPARDLEVTPALPIAILNSCEINFTAPIAFDPRKNGYYYSEPSFRLPCVSVTEGECVALFLAERLLQQYRDTPFAGDIACLFNKIVSLLGEPITINLQHLIERPNFRQTANALGDCATFLAIDRAIRECRQLEVFYWTASRHETCRRVVDPYHLTAVDGDWFLVAFCHLREAVRMFSPHRIRELHETGHTFQPPADFRINDYLDVGFRKVRGDGPAQTGPPSLHGPVAHLIHEKEWHPTQKVKRHTDGS